MKKVIVFLFILSTLFVFVGCNNAEAELSTYNIEAEYLDSGVISAKMKLDYVCDVKDGTDKIKFNVFANAFRENAKITPMSKEDAKKTCGKFDVLKVSSCGVALDYTLCGSDENVLEVYLGKKLNFRDTYTVEICFAVTLPEGDYRMAKGVNTVNIGNWYPVLCVNENGSFVECEYGAIGDPFYSKSAKYNVSLTLPSDYVVASSAKATNCDAIDGKTKYCYKIENARDFAFCLSRKFEVKSEMSGNRTINYYYFKDETPDKTFKVIADCLDFFSKKFGDYPFDTFSVAQSDFNEGGMEYPGLVYVNCELNELNRLYTTVHETAHQWWYSAVGNNQLDESYLDEGLTEYSTAVFFDEYKDYGISAKAIFDSAEKSCKNYKIVLNSIGKEANQEMVRNLNDFESEMHYVNIAYNRGMTMMKAGEDSVGREKMLKYMNGYYKKYKFKIADTQGFLKEMGSASKVLKSYIDGNAA